MSSRRATTLPATRPTSCSPSRRSRPAFYLDANLCERDPDGGWMPSASAGGGFSDLTLEELRASPPPPGIEARRWAAPE